ncbi:hypothetical protein [Vogesella indigofera]|jgi:hypothetical protein|nr:hypothetical protein [Vogesella indigofera]MDC7696394.1 hypothetical protein [Vogesella indigofera]
MSVIRGKEGAGCLLHQWLVAAAAAVSMLVCFDKVMALIISCRVYV